MGNRKGFLLLEVILAMVMIGSGLVFVGRVYSTAADVIARSRSSFIASFLLEEKIFDIQTGAELKDGSAEGEFPEIKGYYWKSEVAAASPQNPELLKVTVGVFASAKKNSADAYWLETYIEKKKL